MKKLLSGLALGAALVVSTASAMADGMPAPRRAAPPIAAGCFNFTGFYVGAHGAWSDYTSSRSDRDGYLNPTLLSPGPSFTEHDDQIGGGLQIGYNYQAPGKCTVLGVEADFSWSKLETSASTVLNLNPALTADWSVRNNIDWIWTLRTRGGIVVDNMLFYMTGGLAFADVETRVNRLVGPGVGPISEANSFSDTRVGWTSGVGIEVALTSNVFFKSEVLYMNFADFKETVTGNPVNFGAATPRQFGFSGTDEVWSTRMGINWRF